jgi:uncharacterized MAPEG superfamily protein
MSIEIKYLAWSIALGIVSVLVAATLGTAQRGLKWNVGNRDGEASLLTGAAARAYRASWNFLETFPFFAAAVLAVVLTHTNSAQTALGAMLYFWARLIYLAVYVIGIPYLRTLVFAVSLYGLLRLLLPLFAG